jgi:hypothetical protein
VSSKGGAESNPNGPAGTADIEGAEMRVIDMDKAYPFLSKHRWFAHVVERRKKAALVRIRCYLSSSDE